MKHREYITKIELSPKEFVKMHTYAFSNYLFSRYIMSFIVILILGYLYLEKYIESDRYITYLILIFVYKAVTNSIDFAIGTVRDYIRKQAEIEAVERFLKEEEEKDA